MVRHMLADTCRTAPFRDAVVVLAWQCWKHIVLVTCRSTLRHPTKGLLVERKIERLLGLVLQYLNSCLVTLGDDVLPLQTLHITDTESAIDGDVKIERQSTKRKILSQQQSDNTPVSSAIKKKGEGFAAVAGMEGLKQQMREEVIEPLHNPEEYHRYGVTIPNGMLLYGPPGCGKTFFAKHFAEEVGFNFMCITPATLKSRYVNATQENIAKMFKEAEENAPTVIFIDEMNELVPNRDDGNVHEMSRSAVNEMLAQMDRTGEKGIFIIGATNYPNMIDPAILRAGRLDKKYYIGVPDIEARMALFRLYLNKRPYDFGLDYHQLADMTQGYVSADIQLIVNDASRNALRQHSKITMELLKVAITNTAPSLSNNELRKYERIRAMMNGEEMKKSDDRPRIGFNV